MSTIHAKIRKYDPTTDEAPYWAEYDVEWHEYMTVLEVLRTIHEQFDPAAFDYNCRGGSCGMCSMKVNGTPVLACQTLVKEDEELVVEPLDRFPVIRDLIVDKSVVRDRVLTTRPQFVRDTPMVNPAPMDPVNYLSTAILQQCRECMLCMSACPAIAIEGFEGYAGPYVMTRIAQRYYDEREGHEQERLRSAVDNGLFKCIECGTCTNVCPKGRIIAVEGQDYSFIDHVRYFKQMKQDAIDAGMQPIEEEPALPLAEGTFVRADNLN